MASAASAATSAPGKPGVPPSESEEAPDAGCGEVEEGGGRLRDPAPPHASATDPTLLPTVPPSTRSGGLLGGVGWAIGAAWSFVIDDAGASASSQAAAFSQAAAPAIGRSGAASNTTATPSRLSGLAPIPLHPPGADSAAANRTAPLSSPPVSSMLSLFDNILFTATIAGGSLACRLSPPSPLSPRGGELSPTAQQPLSPPSTLGSAPMLLKDLQASLLPHRGAASEAASDTIGHDLPDDSSRRHNHHQHRPHALDETSRSRPIRPSSRVPPFLVLTWGGVRGQAVVSMPALPAAPAPTSLPSLAPSPRTSSAVAPFPPLRSLSVSLAWMRLLWPPGPAPAPQGAFTGSTGSMDLQPAAAAAPVPLCPLPTAAGIGVLGVGARRVLWLSPNEEDVEPPSASPSAPSTVSIFTLEPDSSSSPNVAHALLVSFDATSDGGTEGGEQGPHLRIALGALTLAYPPGLASTLLRFVGVGDRGAQRGEGATSEAAVKQRPTLPPFWQRGLGRATLSAGRALVLMLSAPQVGTKTV